MNKPVSFCRLEADTALGRLNAQTCGEDALNAFMDIQMYNGTIRGCWKDLPVGLKTRFAKVQTDSRKQGCRLLASRLSVMQSDRLQTTITKFQDASEQAFELYLKVALLTVSHFEDSAHFSFNDDKSFAKDDLAIRSIKPLCGKVNAPQIALARGKIYDVPQELYNEIVKVLFRAFYLPGSVVADQYPVFDGEDCFAGVEFCIEKSRVLIRIDRGLYDEMKVQYWTNNVWLVTGKIFPMDPSTNALQGHPSWPIELHSRFPPPSA